MLFYIVYVPISSNTIMDSDDSLSFLIKSKYFLFTFQIHCKRKQIQNVQKNILKINEISFNDIIEIRV